MQTLFSVLCAIFNYVFMFCLLWQFAYFILIVFSPHPDTSLQVLANIVISGALFFGCMFVVSSAILCSLIRIIAFVGNGLLHRYLRRIKYYS